MAVDDTEARHAARTGLAWGLLAAFIWSVYTVLARLAVTVGLSPVDLSFLRFAPGALLVAPLLIGRYGLRNLAGLGWRRGMSLTLLAGPVFSLLLMGGFTMAPLAHGAVIAPAFQMLTGIGLSAWFARTWPARESLIGAAFVVVGLLFVGGDGLLHSHGPLTPVGDLLFALAGGCWGVFGALSRRWQVDAMRVTTVIVVVSCVLILPLFVWQFDLARLQRAGWGMVALQAVSQGLGAGLVAVLAYSRAAALLGAGPAAFFGALVPGSAALLAIPVLGEVPTALQAVGIVSVVIGLLIAFGAVRWMLGRRRGADAPGAAGSDAPGV